MSLIFFISSITGCLVYKHSFVFCFLEPVDNKALCEVELQTKDIDQLREAIEDLYYFEFVLGILSESKSFVL